MSGVNTMTRYLRARAVQSVARACCAVLSVKPRDDGLIWGLLLLWVCGIVAECVVLSELLQRKGCALVEVK